MTSKKGHITAQSCREGHPLEIVNAAESSFVCDRCYLILIGQHKRCDICDFDLCQECGNMPLGAKREPEIIRRIASKLYFKLWNRDDKTYRDAILDEYARCQTEEERGEMGKMFMEGMISGLTASSKITRPGTPGQITIPGTVTQISYRQDNSMPYLGWQHPLLRGRNLNDGNMHSCEIRPGDYHGERTWP